MGGTIQNYWDVAPTFKLGQGISAMHGMIKGYSSKYDDKDIGCYQNSIYAGPSYPVCGHFPYIIRQGTSCNPTQSHGYLMTSPTFVPLIPVSMMLFPVSFNSV
jgi:hypothetical protein